jgi:hypothetical protein
MVTMTVFTTILMLCMSSIVAFRIHAATKQSTSLNMCKESESTQRMNKIQRRIKSAIAAILIASSTADISFALPDAQTPITQTKLEQIAPNFEKMISKSDVLFTSLSGKLETMTSALPDREAEDDKIEGSKLGGSKLESMYHISKPLPFKDSQERYRDLIESNDKDAIYNMNRYLIDYVFGTITTMFYDPQGLKFHDDLAWRSKIREIENLGDQIYSSQFETDR